MRYLFIIFLFISTIVSAQQVPASNDEDMTFVLAVDAVSFTGTYPNFSGTLSLGTAVNLFTNYPFSINNIQAGYYIIDSKGGIYKITNATFSSPDMLVDVEKVTTNSGGFIGTFAPTGRVIVSEPEPHCGLLNTAPVDLTGITPLTLAVVHNYNMQRAGNCIDSLSDGYIISGVYDRIGDTLTLNKNTGVQVKIPLSEVQLSNGAPTGNDSDLAIDTAATSPILYVNVSGTWTAIGEATTASDGLTLVGNDVQMNITSLTAVVPVTTDEIVFGDASDTNNEKKATFSTIPLSIFNNDLGITSESTTVTDAANSLDITLTGTDITVEVDMAEVANVTPAAADILLIEDASDSGNPKNVTVADLGLSYGTFNSDALASAGGVPIGGTYITGSAHTRGIPVGTKVVRLF